MRRLPPFPAILTLAVAGILSVGTAPASAGATPGLELDLQWASDYVVRGFSRTEGQPALQLGIRYRHRRGFFAGLSASNAHFAYDEAMSGEREGEVRATVGFGRTLRADWHASAAAVHYAYLGGAGASATAYSEGRLSLQWRDVALARVAYIPDLFGRGYRAWSYELVGRLPLTSTLAVEASLGRSEVGAFDVSHHFGHLGLAWAVERSTLRLGFFRATGPPIPSWGEIVDGSLAATVAVRLR